MKQSVFIFGTLVLAGATLLGGVIQGRMSRRWGGLSEFPKLTDRLKKLPTDVGPWRMRAPQPLSPAAEAVLECAGYVGRQYENRQTGEVVTMAVLLVSGRPDFRPYARRMLCGPGVHRPPGPRANRLRRRRSPPGRTLEDDAPVDATGCRIFAGLLRLEQRRRVVGAGGCRDSHLPAGLICTKFRWPARCRHRVTRRRWTRLSVSSRSCCLCSSST